MYLLLAGTFFIIIAIYLVDWAIWKEFYSTIQYYIICNLLYNFIFYHHTLWSYDTSSVVWIKHTFIEILFSFIIIPVIIMIYLRFFPSGRKGIGYIVLWIFCFWLIEVMFKKMGYFVYDNGWNELWSLFFNMIMFPILRLHSKKPLIAIILSVPIILILLLFFHPSLNEIK
jgi:hypothetical protein